MSPQQLVEPPDPNKRKYLLVFICEAVTVAALWAVGRYFSS
jgi:hypothetical protein